MKKLFRDLADKTADATGSPWAFAIALILPVVWLVLGPACRLSDAWQLTMNPLASQPTFLIAFLLQNTQNRDTRALHLKLDELLRSSEGARTGMINLGVLSDDELDRLQREVEHLRKRERAE